jgi:hypothetical protein
VRMNIYKVDWARSGRGQDPEVVALGGTED